MSDDLISRQAAIYIAFRSPFFSDSLMEELRALPAAQPKTGRWILDTTQFLPEYVCTNCKSRFPLVASGGEFYSTLCCENMNYCPNCGAKMEDNENEWKRDFV